MKTKKTLLLSIFTLIISTMTFAETELTGYEVMKRAEQVETANSGSYTAMMTLTNKKGSVRERSITCYMKEYDGVNKTVIIFNTPKDVAGVGYLMWEYVENEKGSTPEADRWIYMPAMKKVRRISGSGSGDDFMGTDFTYEDIGAV